MLSQDDEQGQKLFWTWPLQKKKKIKKRKSGLIYIWLKVKSTWNLSEPHEIVPDEIPQAGQKHER